VAQAHLAAAKALEDGEPGQTYNIGRGEGASVLEVLRVIGEVTGLDVSPDVTSRRPGDPARVVASVERVRDGLGFQARYGLRDMVVSAWDGWLLRHPEEHGLRAARLPPSAPDRQLRPLEA
jgi:UDP-glucose 4-epimerase